MKQLCIYCGEREATERDHIPPKCFFSTPRPSDLITVPSCSECNRRYGQIDEQARNLITSIDVNESHKAIQKQLAEKRDRSYRRKQGKRNFLSILESLVTTDVYSPKGIYLGNATAFNLDTPVINKFMEQMTRALLFHENSIGYVKCEIEWRMAPTLHDFETMPNDIKMLLLNGKFQTIGNGIFSYIGIFSPNTTNSLWIMSFYEGSEFMSILRV